MAEMHDNYNLPVNGQYYLLLQNRNGVRHGKGRTAFSSSSFGKKSVSLCKGEILAQVPREDQPGDETLLRLTPIERPSITLECLTTEVQRIDHEEANLLFPLCSLSERVRVFQEEYRLKFGKRINIDSEVWVYVPVNGIKREFQGVIRYKGQLPGIHGTMFGVELLNQEGKGSTDGSFKGKQYFCCKKDAGVFVSLEKLAPHPGATKHSASDRPGRSIEVLHEKLDIGSMVEVLSRVSSPKYGVIRWIGFTPNSGKKVAGLELDEEMDTCDDGTFLGRRYFTCPPKRGFFVHLHNCQPDSRLRRENSMTSRDKRLTVIDISSSSELQTPDMGAEERLSGSRFTPNCNEEVADLEMREKFVVPEETAMSGDPFEEIESLLTCSICLEMLTDSRTLGCLHSFCKCCLERYVKRQRGRASAEPAEEELKKSVEEFECPDCRTPFSLKQGQGVEAIPRSHLVNSMLEVVQRRAKEIPPKRRENQEKEKVENVYCKIHEKRELEFYCENCEEIICSYCMVFNHAKGNHSCFPAEDVAEKEREALKQRCNSLEKNLNEANEALQEILNATQLLRKHAEQAKEDITRQKDEVLGTLVHKLEQKAELMMNVVNEKQNEACQQLEIQKSEMEEYIKMLSDSVDLSKNLVDKGTTEQILSSKKMFRENMDKEKNGRPRRMKPVHDGIMEFEIKTVNLTSIVDDLEKIDLTVQITK